MQTHDTPQTEPTGPAAELHNLLDMEREALITGDLERLAELLTPKEALIEAMGDLPLAELTDLQALDIKVRRNQLLFDSALEGIRAVSTRLASLREVKAAFETYGADGRKHDIIPETNSSVERRA